MLATAKEFADLFQKMVDNGKGDQLIIADWWTEEAVAVTIRVMRQDGDLDDCNPETVSEYLDSPRSVMEEIRDKFGGLCPTVEQLQEMIVNLTEDH